MMKVRSIAAEELEKFAEFSDHPTPEAVQSMKELSHQLWAQGNSRPDWFFLAEQDGQLVGRVAY